MRETHHGKSWGYQGHHEQQPAAIIGAQLGYASSDNSLLFAQMYRAKRLKTWLKMWRCRWLMKYVKSPWRNGQRQHGGATLACVGDEAPVPQCSHPPSHSVGESEADPPVRGQLVAYSCLSVYVHSLPPSVDPPQPLLRQKILHYRADRERKWSPLSVRDTFIVQ